MTLETHATVTLGREYAPGGALRIMNFYQFFISAPERVTVPFSEVTELAEIAHEVIFYLNGPHFLE